MKKVIIASTNPVKIAVVESAFGSMFPDGSYTFLGVKIESGVSDQPLTDIETYTGADNRAKSAKKFYPDADYWVGIEGGVESVDDDMQAFARIIVLKEGSDIVGKSKTALSFLPKKVIELIRNGKELGEADDIVFGRTNSKQVNGAVGLLTGDVITRKSFYEQACILALIPFKNPELY